MGVLGGAFVGLKRCCCSVANAGLVAVVAGVLGFLSIDAALLCSVVVCVRDAGREGGLPVGVDTERAELVCGCPDDVPGLLVVVIVGLDTALDPEDDVGRRARDAEVGLLLVEADLVIVVDGGYFVAGFLAGSAAAAADGVRCFSETALLSGTAVPAVLVTAGRSGFIDGGGLLVVVVVGLLAMGSLLGDVLRGSLEVEEDGGFSRYGSSVPGLRRDRVRASDDDMLNCGCLAHGCGYGWLVGAGQGGASLVLVAVTL